MWKDGCHAFLYQGNSPMWMSLQYQLTTYLLLQGCHHVNGKNKLNLACLNVSKAMSRHRQDLKSLPKRTAGKHNILILIDEVQVACGSKQSVSKILSDMGFMDFKFYQRMI